MKNDVLKKEKKLLELESEAYSVNPFVMGYNFALELNDVGMKKEAEQMHASLFTFLDQAYSRMDQNLVLLNVLAYSSIIDDKEQSRNILLRYLSYYDYSKLEIENYYFKMNHVEYLKDYYCLLRKLDVDSEIYLQCDSFLQWSENIVYNEYAEFFYLRADCKKRLSKISEAKVYYERAMEYAFDEIDDDKEQFCDILRDYVSLLREEGCVEEAEYWIEMLDGV